MELKIMLWNSNGLMKNQKELEVVMNNEKIVVCHFTRESFIRFRNGIYYKIHPQNTARGESAVIIRKNIKHY